MPRRGPVSWPCAKCRPSPHEPSRFANSSRSAMMRRPRPQGERMPRILRRTVLEWGVGLAAGSALAQGAKREPVFKPEKDASLRLLRWSGFVKSDEELWNANTMKLAQVTGVPVSVDYITWHDRRLKPPLDAH